MTPEIALLWDQIREQEAPYPPSAYAFVQEGLRHTVDRLEQDDEERFDGESRHISGQELCLGLREFALEQYGLLARTVLRSLGIHRTDDFGRIVFILVEVGLMRKTDEDTLEDFEAVFEFEEAFDSPLGVA